jgi:hypothetical protein
MTTNLLAVVLGQKGDPSSTSSSEALGFIYWSSMPFEGQVVCPRSSSGCQRLDLHVGEEHSSILLSELGRDAWSSPVAGGRGTVVLDCFFSFFLSG